MSQEPTTQVKHYNSHPSGIEAWVICRHLSFDLGNMVKYLFRAPYKGTELLDLRKARAYLHDAFTIAEDELVLPHKLVLRVPYQVHALCAYDDIVGVALRVLRDATLAPRDGIVTFETLDDLLQGAITAAEKKGA